MSISQDNGPALITQTFTLCGIRSRDRRLHNLLRDPLGQMVVCYIIHVNFRRTVVFKQVKKLLSFAIAKNKHFQSPKSKNCESRHKLPRQTNDENKI